MCWLALDAAIDLASALGARDRPQEWTRVGDAIHAAACERGWNAQRGCFVQSFGSDALDASALMLSIVGFLPSRDPRIVAAIAAIARELTDERGLVYCYRGGDGLEGDEGTFLMCTFWLAHAYALGDDRARAEATFTSALRCANGLGLFSEEIDSSGEPLGNFPQAFSHVGLVNAAWAIAELDARRP